LNDDKLAKEIRRVFEWFNFAPSPTLSEEGVKFLSNHKEEGIK
jgi:hypothetical protein